MTNRDRRALRAVHTTTAAACSPDSLAETSCVLAELVRAPLGVVAAGDPASSGRTVGATLASVSDDALWSRTRPLRTYDPNKLDDFANRPVNTASLGCRFPQRVEHIQQVSRLFGIVYQLRTVVAVGGVFVGYVGTGRTSRDGAFDLAAHRRMAAALPRITDLLVANRALRSRGARGLVACLDAFDQCAFLLLGKTIAYANCAARERYPVFPEWLRGAASGDMSASSALARVTRVESDGRTYVLVIPRSPPNGPSPFAPLTRSLRRVAELMADGRSDKEIAVLTGYTLATARTFASRVLAQLGLRRRGELARLVRGR